ncbi:MAG TPA: 3-phosphoshikimate 1-carboxyvinyltransferase [Terriglobia bacterium]|nr:3-phosphoshikimate 1-carboxyvinyltransferase [Terriglobia bacterium]
MPDTQKIDPARRLQGSLTLPGDKSISHRYAMLGAIAEGLTEIRGFASSADCQSTLDCLRALGVEIERQGGHVAIHGRGLRGLRAPTAALDAGNSGSTMRMLAGILAGQSFESCVTGDDSLSRRPMKRIIDPLSQMGAKITSADRGLPPLRITGGPLKPIRYQPPVASAQVKTAVLFAGLLADGQTQVEEPVPTRDHTEIALEQMGAPIARQNGMISVDGPGRLAGLRAEVPGDVSAAAFFLAAALMAPESDLLIQRVGLNPTRTAAVEMLRGMGAEIEHKNVRTLNGEPVGDLRVRCSALDGGAIPSELIPNLIDELPVLSVLGTQTQQGVSFHGAQELRVKESDRLTAVAANLRRLGAEVEEFPDGLSVPGQQKLRGAEIESYGDHRIAMAFAVAGLIAEGGVTIRGSDCTRISFPEFFETLARIAVPR